VNALVTSMPHGSVEACIRRNLAMRGATLLTWLGERTDCSRPDLDNGRKTVGA
jgi:hypothetical protein